jgi:hypothetical protein
VNRILVIALVVMLTGCGSPHRRTNTNIPPCTDNPHPKGSDAWSAYEMAHIKRGMTRLMAADLEARDPKAARKFRQGVALMELKQGEIYNFGKVGMPDQILDDSGSPTVVYVYEKPSKTTYVTVDKQTQVVTNIKRHQR